MKVFADTGSGKPFEILQMRANEFDAIKANPKLSGMVGLSWYWREGSSPPELWPVPASRISIRVTE